MQNIYKDGHYLELNPTWDVEDSPWKASQIVKMIQKNDLRPKSICEIGCGAGEILKHLQANLSDQIELWGYDISPQAIKLCQGKANKNLRFRLCDITEDENIFFDLLLILDVVEHIENYQKFLRDIRGKGEYKIFHVPLELNVLSIIRKIPIKRRRQYGHINHFSKDTILQSLIDNGYEILDYSYTETAFVAERGTLKVIFGKLPLRLVFKLNNDWLVRLMGGHSLIILSK